MIINSKINSQVVISDKKNYSRVGQDLEELFDSLVVRDKKF